MKQSIYLTNNNQETLEKLKSLGFNVCACCTFKGVQWLHFYYRTLNTEKPIKEFHGIGNGCENSCTKTGSKECIMCTLHEEIFLNKNDVHIFNNVDDCVEYINKYYD